MALAAGAVLGYSQGTISIGNTTSTYFISTNATAVGGNIGVTSGGTGAFFYTVLTATDTGTPPSTSTAALANTGIWTATGVTGSQNSLTKGGITSGAGQAATGWPLPTGFTYAAGPTNYFVVVGWSAAEGTSWTQVSGLINGAGLTAGGFFGVSAVGTDTAGGQNSLGAVLLWGNQTTVPGQGLTSGFQLFSVVSAPEPSTMALAALGGASLLLFRRRK